MAFQARVLIDGQLTLRTMDVETVLRIHAEQGAALRARARAKPPLHLTSPPPVTGLLTHTVIKSPVIHWALPVRLRSWEQIDVAFIGNDFVQVRELKPESVDGQLCDIIDYEGFGSRIRNTCVVGSTEPAFKTPSGDLEPVLLKSADAEDEPLTETSPQGIILILESGHIVLLLLENIGSGLCWSVGRFSLPNQHLELQPGTHLAIDPSSRYLAVGCSEGYVMIYELYSRDSWKRSSADRRYVQFVKGTSVISITGTIISMDFLFPFRNDGDHVILVVIVSRRGRSRMLVYEWTAGDSLHSIRHHGHEGHALGPAHQLPLLLIPLKFETAFILVFENFIASFRGILEGPPTIEEFSNEFPRPTPNHCGKGAPLWTAWSRPARTNPTHLVVNDDIYIAREDGLIKFLELNKEDFVRGDTNVAQCSCNIGTAFTSLDYVKPGQRSGDLLVAGGGAGVGGTFLLLARRNEGRIELIQNWSPAQDFLIVPDLDADDSNGPSSTMSKTPDRLFTCMGKGAQSAVTELRYGLEARLGLESLYSTPIMQVWVASPVSTSYMVETLMLLSLPDRSALLRLASNAEELEEVDQADSSFDFTSRTVTARVCGELTIQVTEQSIRFINENTLVQEHHGPKLLSAGQFISNAIIFQGSVLFTTYCGPSAFVLQMVERAYTPSHDNQTSQNTHSNTIIHELATYDARVTSLAMCVVNQIQYAIVAQGLTLRLFQTPPMDQPNGDEFDIPTGIADAHVPLEAVISMAVVSTTTRGITLLCGTSNGFVVTLEVRIASGLAHCTYWYIENFGATSAVLTLDDLSASRVFVTCDRRMYAISVRSSNTLTMSRTSVNRIWITEAHTPTLSQHAVDAIAPRGPNLPAGTEGGLLVISGSHILLVGLSNKPKAVPRHLPIRGAPSRIIYSHKLRTFIVAASVNTFLHLQFIDPDTGIDISKPVDHDMDDVSLLSGLKDPNDYIYDICEWSYTKDNKPFYFVIVCTRSGRLLFISTEKTDENATTPPGFSALNENTSGTSPPTKIRFWTRHKIRNDNPIYSVATNREGICYSAGKVLYYDRLIDKKFRHVASQELLSPAISLSIEVDTIYALTQSHSLEIFKIRPSVANPLELGNTHSDQVTRHALHFIKISYPLDGAPKGSLYLVSDKLKSIAGLWPSYDTTCDTIDTVFEAQLPYSMLRLRSGFTRPSWELNRLRAEYGRKSNKTRLIAESPDILGMGIDGSLCHFTLLSAAEWHFLKFLTNLAQRSPRVCPFTYDLNPPSLEPAAEPKIMMHVDGDVLRRCLDNRELEQLLGKQSDADETKQIYELLMNVTARLWHFLGTVPPMLATDPLERCIANAYDMLAHYLRPVI